MSSNRTRTSIGHVARVSPALLSRDNQAAVPWLVAMVTGVRLREVTRANSCHPEGWGRSVGNVG